MYFLPPSFPSFLPSFLPSFVFSCFFFLSFRLPSFLLSFLLSFFPLSFLPSLPSFFPSFASFPSFPSVPSRAGPEKAIFPSKKHDKIWKLLAKKIASRRFKTSRREDGNTSQSH